MSDFKSKLPSLSEVTQMAGKLYNDVKNSVCDIMRDYKANHPSTPETPPPVKPVVTPPESVVSSEPLKSSTPEDVIVPKQETKEPL